MSAPPAPQDGFAVILVEPQLGENIGMVARAMWNCGLSDLRLVNPRDGWPSQAAIDASAGAVPPIEAARLFPSVDAAMADLDLVFASSDRVRDLQSRVLRPEAAAREMRARAVQGGKAGVLFGPERTGLSNDDVARANGLIQIPANAAFTSLNLAQAVLLIGFDWWRAGMDGPAEWIARGDTEPATKAEVENLYARLVAGLEAGGFFRSPKLKPTTLRNLRALLERAGLSAQETRTLQGVVSALRRAPPAEDAAARDRD